MNTSFHIRTDFPSPQRLSGGNHKILRMLLVDVAEDTAILFTGKLKAKLV